MRYIITIILSVIFAQSFGQVQYIGGVNTTVINRGAFRSDSVVILPSRDTGTGYASQPYKGRMTVHSDSNLYYHNGSVWRDISSGTDTTSLSNRINVNKDSITYLGLNYYKNGGNSFGAAATIGTNDANYFALKANNTEALRIFSSTQNIRIGGTTDNGDKLSVNGTIHATGSGGVSFRMTSGTAIRSDGTIYIDALNYTEGIINLRYGLGLSGEANFNNNGARLNQLHAVGSRLSGNYLANSSTISRGLEFRSEENSGNNYVNLRPTYYATAGTFTDYAWIVLADQGKGVIIGSQYKNATSDILQVTGNINLTTAGNKINIKSGTNSSVGTATLVGGTVTVNTTAVTASSIVLYNRATTGGTVGNLSYTKVAGTSITFNSDNALETSTIDYIIIDAY